QILLTRPLNKVISTAERNDACCGAASMSGGSCGDEDHGRQRGLADAAVRLGPTYRLRRALVDHAARLAGREAEPRDELGEALLERLGLEQLRKAHLAARLERLAQSRAQPLLVHVELLEQRIGGQLHVARLER